MQVTNISMALLAALSATAFTPAVQAEDGPAYWVGTDGKYVRSGYGECVRTRDWTPQKAVAGCDGGSKPAPMTRQPAPVTKPEPVASAAPAPARAPAPAPARVSAEPQYRNLSLASGATFELGGSTLSASGKSAVAAILGEFEGEEIRSVVVEGHTDDRGAAAFNQQLSEKRAAAVKAELIANGIDAGLIKTVGHGESKPIADNATREGRAQNRRVDIKIDARTRKL